MKMKTRSLFASACVGALSMALSASANIIVNPGFDAAFAGTYESSANFGGGNFPIGTGAAAGGALIYDDGWITYDSSGAMWELSAGEASRTASRQFQLGGFGQIVSNPGDGSFDNGEDVYFGFDYVFNAPSAPPSGAAQLIGSVYGITAPNGTSAMWNLSADEAIDSMGQSGTPAITSDYTAGTDYQFYLLDTFTDDSQSAVPAAYSSSAITLTRQYDLFAVVFQGEPDGDGAGVMSVDDVYLTAIPEPSVLSLALLSGLGLLALRRRR